MVTRQMEVGLASLFLPSHPIPHAVTSHRSPSLTVRHEAEQRPTKPFSYRSLLHLYKGSNTDILFQQYAKAFSNNQSKEILSKLNKLDLQDASNGFEFMGKVFRWMEQDLNQQLPTGYAYTGPLDVWRMTITAEDNNTTWLLRFTDIDPTNQKSVPYFAINLFLA